MRRQAGAVALLGALLVLTSDFAGWYTRQTGVGLSSSPSRTGSAAQDLFFSYSASDSTDAINIWSPYLPVLLVVVALLGATGYLALRTPPPTLALPMNASLWMIPAAAAAATLLFGLIFLIAMLVADPDDWWLDVGFFAGLVGGGLAAYLLRRTEPTPVR